MWSPSVEDKPIQDIPKVIARRDDTGSKFEARPDRARLLFFEFLLKISNGDWSGSAAQLETALKAAEGSKHPELRERVIEPSLNIHSKLDRTAA
jgi:hypothetical protein